MSLVNDYFLLYHGKNCEQKITYGTDHYKNRDEFFEVAALVLAPTRKDYEKYITLDSFKKLITHVTNKKVKSLDDLNQLQYCIIDSIENDTQNCQIEKLHESLEYLKKERILDSSNFNKLISLFDPNELGLCDEDSKDEHIQIDESKSFKEIKIDFENLIIELEEIFQSQEYKEELKSTKEYLENQKFSIGITGVMNAGKSTMLNALMGKEILGSAVVPETANLTIVKHGIPEANVFYWNKEEWNRIEQSGKQLESIKEFVNETKKIFGEEINNYIHDDSYSEKVDINNLAAYTSAEASGKKCNLVKYVELKSDLRFLENGIEIVDTPGLDDPVIQREEITKEYLNQCDLMIHLMNVSQSATLKDVEFIIDALLYQNITKLLIVITRADTVEKAQLQEVIDYTKTSIEAQLKAQNKDSQLDYILRNIKFIPISGKMALYHRTGREKEALEAGFKEEDTGILEIENYLEETLFGKSSSKTDLIIKGIKTQLRKTIEKEIKSFNYELILLGKTKEELEEDLKDFAKRKSTNESIFEAMNEDIAVYKNDAKSYILTLKTFLENELLDLQEIIRKRVFSDVKYSFEKTKKRPESKRIKTIVETAIKDGIVDVIRDYRYKFIKKSQNIGEVFEQKYQEMGFTIGHKNENFDARGFFENDFKSGFLTSSNEVLINKITNEVSKSKDSKLGELDRSLQEFIKDEFEPIEKNIKEKAQNVSKVLIDNFFAQISEPLKVFEKKLLKDEKALEDRISSFEENDSQKDELTIEIHKKVKKLETFSKELKA
ncbi:Dynamin family protein [Arcobacter nitrofigilis DSM 7299]|uniref:Dynamin family protein n=1 Tax=Arcobacter nitrofigilis (strain ATCC 33309 / DSM 7299 / CCUG 15893 / LMG 7604 / NCTC 12251 / CI) TaxID=572480 RepID=D5V6P7_ARCNC|nr:dynamin family protein [Arcobacter nitrofigilis]ADG94317.1 Dynamin family protein [Arcobacter nitrofigilis DSM 7299]